MSTFTINKYNNGNTLKQNILLIAIVLSVWDSLRFFFVTETGMQHPPSPIQRLKTGHLFKQKGDDSQKTMNITCN